jgi:hypothetical protein
MRTWLRGFLRAVWAWRRDSVTGASIFHQSPLQETLRQLPDRYRRERRETENAKRRTLSYLHRPAGRYLMY